MAISAVVGLAFAAAGVTGQLTAKQGVHKFCDSGRRHTVTYAVQQKISDDDMFNLNTVPALQGVQCDIDGSKVALTFAHAAGADSFIKGFGAKVMVGGGDFGCTYVSSTASRGVLLKYALLAKPSPVDGQESVVHVVSAPMAYTEVYDKMNISYASKPDAECEAEERRLQIFPTCPSASWCCQGANGNQECIPCNHTIFGHCNDMEGSSQEETCTNAGLKESSDCHSVGPTPPPGPDHGKKYCFGVNVDTTTCTQASAPVPIYTNNYVQVKCESCFIGFRTEIFFNINLDGGYLHELQAGFKDTGISSGLELEIDGQASWSTGIDKTIWQKSDVGNPLVHFNIGPIPFLVWFDTSGNFKADLSMDTTAVAIAGVSGDYNVGDNYISWDMENHWTHVQTTPTFDHAIKTGGNINVKTHGDVTQTAVASMHLDKLFTGTLTFEQTAQFDVNGDVKGGMQVCEDASHKSTLTINVDLNVDLPFHLLTKDYKWNKVLWQVNGTIPKMCQNVPGGAEVVV